MAEYVATQRPRSGVLMLSGALPVSVLGAQTWPNAVPAQIHYSEHGPFRPKESTDALINDILAAGASVETFYYPGAGHLFTDPSLSQEYDAQPPRRCGNARPPSFAPPTTEASPPPLRCP